MNPFRRKKYQPTTPPEEKPYHPTIADWKREMAEKAATEAPPEPTRPLYPGEIAFMNEMRKLKKENEQREKEQAEAAAREAAQPKSPAEQSPPQTVASPLPPPQTTAPYDTVLYPAPGWGGNPAVTPQATAPKPPVSYPAPVWGGYRTTAAAPPEKEKIILPPLPIAVPETEKTVPPPTAAYKPIQDTDVITVLPLDLLDPYPNNPFKPYRSEQLEELAESIREMGIMNPILVRKKDGGRYEILAGHNRTAAARLLEHTAIPCIIREADDDTAAIIVTENNLRHREFLLPSEKAFAYKMQLESMKRQAGRPGQENYSQLGNNSSVKTSSAELAESVGESKNQIFRYIRLTYLIPDFLEMVDERRLAFTPAVEISYLGQPEQKAVFKYFFHDKKGLLDIKTAKLLRERSSMVELNTLEIMLLMNKNRRVVAYPKFTHRDFKKLNQYIPQGTPKTEMMEILLNALKQYYA